MFVRIDPGIDSIRILTFRYAICTGKTSIKILIIAQHTVCAHRHVQREKRWTQANKTILDTSQQLEVFIKVILSVC